MGDDLLRQPLFLQTPGSGQTIPEKSVYPTQHQFAVILHVIDCAHLIRVTAQQFGDLGAIVVVPGDPQPVALSQPAPQIRFIVGAGLAHPERRPPRIVGGGEPGIARPVLSEVGLHGDVLPPQFQLVQPPLPGTLYVDETASQPGRDGVEIVDREAAQPPFVAILLVIVVRGPVIETDAQRGRTERLSQQRVKGQTAEHTQEEQSHGSSLTAGRVILILSNENGDRSCHSDALYQPFA
ncbi:hypothetical protein D3C75_865640 [compost metagenome]